MSLAHQVFRLAARGDRTKSESAELRRAWASSREEDLFEEAKKNQIVHIVGFGAKQEGLLGPAGEWARELESNAKAKERLFDTLKRVFEALDAEGIAAAAIESGAVAASSGMALESLGSGDVDLLVDSRKDAERVLHELGFRETARGRTPTSRREFALSAAKSRPVRVEFGERAFERYWTELPFDPREAEWLSRRAKVAGYGSITTLAPTDLLVQVATHTSMHSYVRSPGLRLFVDVDRMVRAGATDWPHFLREARALQATRRIWLALTLAQDLLGTPIPTSVLQDLSPPALIAAALESLIKRNGVFVGSRPKLPPVESLVLDVLLEDAGPADWLGRTLLPSADWLSDRFSGSPAAKEARLTLAFRRFAAAWQRWRPS